MYYSILWHNNDRACIFTLVFNEQTFYDPQAIGCHVRCYDRRRDAGEVDLVRTQSDAETPGLGSTRRYRRSTCCFDLQRALRSDHGSLCAGVMGAVIAPLTLLGGPLMVRAAGTPQESWGVCRRWPCVLEREVPELGRPAGRGLRRGVRLVSGWELLSV